MDAKTKYYLAEILKQFIYRNRATGGDDWENNQYILGYDAALTDIKVVLGIDLGPQGLKKLREEAEKQMVHEAGEV